MKIYYFFIKQQSIAKTFKIFISLQLISIVLYSSKILKTMKSGEFQVKIGYPSENVRVLFRQISSKVSINSVSFLIYFYNILEISWTKFSFFRLEIQSEIQIGKMLEIPEQKLSKFKSIKKVDNIVKNIDLKIHQKFHEYTGNQNQPGIRRKT